MEAEIDIAHLKFLSPQELHQQINNLTKGMLVTKEKFELLVPQCTLADIEWNHMDQFHRQCVHQTYEKVVRIARGRDFAVSLTQWGKWPLLIPVTDVYVAKGLFYQSLTLAGLIFLHSIISMQEAEDGILLTDEWYIASHRWLRFLHRPLHRKLFKLNHRLQQEDQQIRNQRYHLRQKGFHFKTDEPDYYNSNNLALNTIYPGLGKSAFILLSEFSQQRKHKSVEKCEFIIKKEQQDYLIWPGICPHEGGPLGNGTVCDKQISCPWHGLKFSAVRLSLTHKQDEKYGFHYQLTSDRILIGLTLPR